MDDDEKKDILHNIRYILGRAIYTDKFGRPISLMEWSNLRDDREYSIINQTDIAQTTECEPSYLSTVWLGLDHNLWPLGPPLVFETMRFAHELKTTEAFGVPHQYHPTLSFPDPDDNDQRTEQVRWSTEEQARLGHARIMRLIQELEMQ